MLDLHQNIKEALKERKTLDYKGYPFPSEPLWKETLEVIQRLSEQSNERVTPSLISELLNFNSEETRERYGAYIYKRLFGANKLYGEVMLKVVRSGVKASVVESLWRSMYFRIEPVIGKTFLDILWPREPGSVITRGEIKNYVQGSWRTFGSKIMERTILCLKQAGVIRAYEKDFVVSGFGNLEEPLMIMLHLIFVLETPAVTISMVTIEENNFWKFLGYRNLDHVRIALRKAELDGLLARYAIVDHIEQITTKYSLSTFITNMSSL